VTSQDFRLLVLDLVMYGLRTLAYGVLAAGDPSFVAAVREIRSSRKSAAAINDKRTVTNLYFASASTTSTGTGTPVESVVSTSTRPHKVSANAKEDTSEMKESAGVEQGTNECWTSDIEGPGVQESQEDIKKIVRQL
ncbi:hypothetical protein E4T56_gene14772, partial [Termitomyces sp. T112]